MQSPTPFAYRHLVSSAACAEVETFTLHNGQFLDRALEDTFRARVFRSYKWLHLLGWASGLSQLGAVEWDVGWQSTPIFAMINILGGFVGISSRIWLHSLEDQFLAQRIGSRIWITWAIAINLATAHEAVQASLCVISSSDGTLFEDKALIVATLPVIMFTNALLNASHGMPWQPVLLITLTNIFNLMLDAWACASTINAEIDMVMAFSFTFGTVCMLSHTHTLRKAQVVESIATHHSDQRVAEQVAAQERLASYLFHEVRSLAPGAPLLRYVIPTLPTCDRLSIR